MKNCEYSTKLLDKLRKLDSKNQLDFALIEKAVFWAQKYHDGQLRKSGEPFYSHPIEVACMISDYLLKTDVIVASILHDIVEDTEVTAGMILDEFSWRIAEMVDRLTRDRPDGSKISIEEIIINAYRNNDKEVLLIKVIDRLHNMQTIMSQPPKKIKKISEETINNFLYLAMYFELSKVEEQLIMLCTKAMLNDEPLTKAEPTSFN